MFHPSEEIIITSDTKKLSRATRQRASTWSATEEPHNTHGHGHGHHPNNNNNPGSNSNRGSLSKLKNKQPFGHRRQQSSSSQNSKISLGSLERAAAVAVPGVGVIVGDYGNGSVGGGGSVTRQMHVATGGGGSVGGVIGNANVNVNAVPTPLSSSRSVTFNTNTQDMHNHNLHSRESSLGSYNGPIFQHSAGYPHSLTSLSSNDQHPKQSLTMSVAFPLPPLPSSHASPSASTLSPMEVNGVSKEGLHKWLHNDNADTKIKGIKTFQHLIIPSMYLDEEVDYNDIDHNNVDPYEMITPRAKGAKTDQQQQDVFQVNQVFPLTLSSRSRSSSLPSQLLGVELSGEENHQDVDAGGAGGSGSSRRSVDHMDGDVIYPPNINIATGPVSTTWTEDSHKSWDDDDGMIVQKDTFDTPNSRGSRASCVRFVDDKTQSQQNTPTSYTRKPPASLFMEEADLEQLRSRVHDNHDMGIAGENKDENENEYSDEYRQDHDLESSDQNALMNSMRPKSPEQAGENPGNESWRTLYSYEDGIWSKRDLYATRSDEMFDVASDMSKTRNLRLAGDGADGSRRDVKQELGICGKACAKCWCFPHAPKPSWSRVSSAVVRHAPCFWCCLRRAETSGTDRVTLTRLNVLCAICALWQFSVGIFILVVFLSDNITDRNLGTLKPRDYYREALTPNLWMMSGSLLLLSLVGLVLFFAMIITIPVIRQVNLVGAIRFMWVLYWILPLQIFLVIALFDYHNVTDVWIKHWWGAPSMAWFRELFCEPGTANTKCAVPYRGGANYANETLWCTDNYDGAEDCEQIRAAATKAMSGASYSFFYINAIIGGVLVILLLLSLGLLEGIISAPIVQRSKETNIPLWLMLPCIGCFSCGCVLLFSPQSLLSNERGSSTYWIGTCFMLSGVTFSVAALLGWFM